MARAASKKTPPVTGEPQAFQAEVAKLLQLMVHSVYSDRDVFLRELISNSSDALDKLRYEAIATPDLLEQDAKLTITITPDKVAKTLTIADTGIGMDAGELTDNLGIIAKSGTQAFVAKVKDAPNLIGQFGVGFYSAFIVATLVEVFSRKAGSAAGHVWSSAGEGTFSVSAAADLARGTRIVLHLRDDALDYLEPWKLEQVVRSYSDHVGHPIMLRGDGDEVRQINSANAIWTRPKSEVTAEQHKEFFATLSHGDTAPALTIHYRAEGRHEYTVLLYVPAEKPFDLYDPERKGRQKLYVKRVYIADDVALLPPYLRFVRGVIDSADMPLNLSREMLQNNVEVAAIRKAVTNKVLGELKRLAEQEPGKFALIWEAFAAVIKEGLYEDFERQDQLLELARFRSTTSEAVSLKDYVGNLQENQTAIYYLTGEDAKKVQASPQLEGYRARGIEVLLLTDPIDSFWVRTVQGYDGKPLRSIAQGAADLDLIPVKNKPAEPQANDDDLGALLAVMKLALGDQVKDVRISKRLAESAVCLVNEGDMDRTLEKLLARQKDSGIGVSAPVLEINASHGLIKALGARAKADVKDPVLADAAFVLLGQAHVLEGEPLGDPGDFAARLSGLLVKLFS
jgi:molecular chaperone HtpG